MKTNYQKLGKIFWKILENKKVPKRFQTCCIKKNLTLSILKFKKKVWKQSGREGRKKEKRKKGKKGKRQKGKMGKRENGEKEKSGKR